MSTEAGEVQGISRRTGLELVSDLEPEDAERRYLLRRDGHVAGHDSLRAV